MERKINPATGCYCTFSQRMVGDGCDLCNPEYAEEMRKENEINPAEQSTDSHISAAPIRGQSAKGERE